MAFLKLLNIQGMIGIVAALCLSVMLIGAKLDARRWHKQSDRYEKLYRGEASAHAGTVANYRAAAEQARAADKANAERVKTEQAAINKESTNDLQARLADARARFERLRRDAQAAANPGGGGTAPVPGVPAGPGRAGETAGENRLSDADALIATEQAIQLDELIKWVKRQAGVEPSR